MGGVGLGSRILDVWISLWTKLLGVGGSDRGGSTALPPPPPVVGQ